MLNSGIRLVIWVFNGVQRLNNCCFHALMLFCLNRCRRREQHTETLQELGSTTRIVHSKERYREGGKLQTSKSMATPSRHAMKRQWWCNDFWCSMQTSGGWTHAAIYEGLCVLCYTPMHVVQNDAHGNNNDALGDIMAYPKANNQPRDSGLCLYTFCRATNRSFSPSNVGWWFAPLC
jgi:hypothetical protein